MEKELENSKLKKGILFAILAIVTIIVRIPKPFQTDFDSYWLYAMGESLQLHKAALWVFHPASLFGYYPLSYPSGTPFFLGMQNALMGTEMYVTVFLSSIIAGLFLAGMTFILAKKFHGSWLSAYVAAFVISLSPLIINYTSFNAAGRITVLLFVLPFLWSIMHWQETKRLKYLILAFFLLIFAFFMHRTAQLLAIYLLAALVAIVVYKMPRIWQFIKNHRHYRKYIHPRYEKSKYYVLLDLAIIVFVFVIAKLADLIVRGRFGENFQNKIVLPVAEMMSTQETVMRVGLVIGAIIVILFIIAAYMKFIKKKKVIRTTRKFLHEEYHKIFINPQKYFVFLLLIITLVIFVRQFFGVSFYSPSLTEFQATEFFVGKQPYIIFANFVINYTAAVSPLFLLAAVGFLFVLFKKEKTVNQWMLIFICIGISGILLDKKYVRMFITPLLAILIGYGSIRIFEWIKKKGVLHKTKNVLSYAFLFLVMALIIFGSFIPNIRATEFGLESSFSQVDWYWEAGQYIRGLDCDCSTITTDELAAGVIIFASSGVPGGSHNIYYFIDRDKLEPQSLTWSDVTNKVSSGSKIENLWILPDWIFGGQYYVGKHARYLFNNAFYDEASKIIVEQYNEKFYIHDKNLDSNDFLDSIEPVKNKIYDNAKVKIYEIDRGRE